jgi:hypothetical protein
MSMNLYRVELLRTTGSSVQHDRPVLIADIDDTTWRVDASVRAEHLPAIRALKEGEQHVVALESNGVTIRKGVRIERLPDYRMNRVCFDREAKEYVLISNGTCIFDHFNLNPETFKESHQGGDCEYKACSAIALRPFVEGGKVLLAWTHRSVRHEDLQPVSNETEVKARHFDAVLQKRRSSRFIGRV